MAEKASFLINLIPRSSWPGLDHQAGNKKEVSGANLIGEVDWSNQLNILTELCVKVLSKQMEAWRSQYAGSQRLDLVHVLGLKSFTVAKS